VGWFCGRGLGVDEGFRAVAVRIRVSVGFLGRVGLVFVLLFEAYIDRGRGPGPWDSSETNRALSSFAGKLRFLGGSAAVLP
jgi:hypothetical protein